MSALDLVRDRLHRAARHDRVRDPEAFLAPLRGGVGLEVGGPSAVFRTGGGLPAYPALAQVDGVQWAAETHWHGRMEAGRYEHGEPGREGRLWILEGGDLGALPAGAYDVVLSSHVVEHLANPLAALRGWLRVLRPGGHLLTVLPHKEGTFDHRRPVTALAHLIADEERGTGEDDMTHAEEVLALHDLARDTTEGGRAGLEALVRDNLRRRMVHHHVFTTRSALAVLDHLGLEVVVAEARWPHDVYTLARLPAAGEPRPDNARWLAPGAAWARRSPFGVDRETDD